MSNHQYTRPRVNDGPFRYLGILDDVHLAPGDFTEASNVVPLATLAEAERYLLSSYGGYVSISSNHTFVNLAGQDTGRLPGGLSHAATLTLYRLPVVAHDLDAVRVQRDLIIETGDWYPDYVLSVGPRGGVKRERA